MKKDFKKLAIILFFCFLSFVFFGLLSDPFLSDSSHYMDGAVNLLENREFSFSQGKPTNYREPGYSFFMAGVFGIFGKNNFLAVRYCQFFLFASLIVCAYFILKKYFKNEKVSFWTVFLLAVFPSFSYYAGIILSESIYIFLLGLSALLLLDICKNQFIGKKYLLLAIILGAATLIKTATLIIILLFFLFFIVSKKYKQAIVFVVLIFLLITPWMFRNYQQFGEFSLTGGRAEGLYFAAGYFMKNSSPSDYLTRAWLRIKKGFQLEMSQEEKDFVFNYNENEIAFGDNRHILLNYMENNPDLKEKDLKKYYWQSALMRPFNFFLQVSLNLATTLSPEIPTAIKQNYFFENRTTARKTFFIFYALFYFLIYVINLLFVIKIFKFKKEYLPFYLLYLSALATLSGYSLIMIDHRYNTPFMFFYVILAGLYFDYKYKEKSFAL